MNAQAKMVEAIAGAERKFRNSRSQVVQGHAFFGAMLLRQRVVASWDCEAMATTGKEIFYNPDWVNQQRSEHLQATIAHEALHPAFCHHTRRGNRDWEMWNEACDYAINPILVEAGFHLPPGALLRDDMVGKSAETCYKILKGERDAEQAQDDQQQDDQQQQQDDDQSQDDEQQGQEQGDESDDQDDEQQQDGEGDTDGSTPPPTPRPIESEQDDDGDADGQGDGQGDDDQQGDSEDGDADGEGDGAGKSGDGQQQKVPSIGGMGAVLDAPVADEAERADEENDWKVAVVQAVNFAKASENAGDLPGDLIRQIDEMIDPVANWRELLRRFMTQFAKTDYSWSTPNRRHIADGLYLPSLQSEQLPPFLFVGDASGSMPQDSLAAAQAELQDIVDDMHPEFVDVIFHDTRVTSVTRYEDGEEIVLDAKGGGGTRFAPVVDWINENADEGYCVVIWFTDLYTQDWDQCDDPDVPVLFIDWTATHDDPHFAEDVIALVDDWS